MDEPLVKFDKSDDQMDLSHACWGQAVTDASHLDGIHLYSTFQEDKTKILYHGLSKHAYLGLEVEPMPAEDV